MYRGGQRANRGSYLGLRSGAWVNIPDGGGTLPGPTTEVYAGYRTAMALGPFLGMAYFVFFPAVGLVLGGKLMFQALAHKIRHTTPTPDAEASRKTSG